MSSETTQEMEAGRALDVDLLRAEYRRASKQRDAYATLAGFHAEDIDTVEPYTSKGRTMDRIAELIAEEICRAALAAVRNP